MNNKLLPIIVITFFGMESNIYSQTTIDRFGKMTIAAQTSDWDPTLRVKVSTENSCAFNLWSPFYNEGDDVSFFNAQGYLWCRLGGWFGSDSTLKRNITPIDSATYKLMHLKGRRFQFKPLTRSEERGYDTLPGHGYRYGLIAQEVENVLPEVVLTLPNGTKSITYTDLIPILIEAVKLQQEEIERMKSVLIENGLMER